MIKILNLTLTAPTAEQTAAGVVDLGDDVRKDLAEIYYFGNKYPELSEIVIRAELLAAIAQDAGAASALVDGPAWMLSALEVALRQRGISPLYAWGSRFVVPPMPVINAR